MVIRPVVSLPPNTSTNISWHASVTKTPLKTAPATTRVSIIWISPERKYARPSDFQWRHATTQGIHLDHLKPYITQLQHQTCVCTNDHLLKGARRTIVREAGERATSTGNSKDGKTPAGPCAPNGDKCKCIVAPMQSPLLACMPNAFHCLADTNEAPAIAREHHAVLLYNKRKKKASFHG